MNLQSIGSKDLGRRIGLELGSPGLLGIVESSGTHAAESIAKRLGQNAGRLEAPADAGALTVGLSGSTADPLIVTHLDALSRAAWQRLDRQRDRLVRRGLTLFILSRRAAERLSCDAPNLASLFSGFYLWTETAATESETGEDANDQEEFERLARQWTAETGVIASVTRKIRHPAYQRIIAMGERAIPPILRALEREPDLWGPALHAITGALPVPPEEAGRVSRVAQAWLRWARDNGYVW